MVWCSIVFVVIGGWVFKTISEQDETIYSDWDDDENFNDEVG